MIMYIKQNFSSTLLSFGGCGYVCRTSQGTSRTYFVKCMLPLDSLGFCLLLPSVFAPLCSMSVCVCIHKVCVYINLIFKLFEGRCDCIWESLFPEEDLHFGRLLCQDVS